MAGNPPTVPLPVEETAPTTASAIHPDDLDDDWFVDDSKRGWRIRAATAGLLVVGLLGGGFWGGVVAEKHHGSGKSGTSSLASAFAGLRAGRTGSGTGTGGFGSTGFGGGGGSATAGTVIGVQGNVLDISDSSGNIVKVTVGSSATITRTAASTLGGLQVGDTVVVTGSTGANGTVNATAVRATAKGTTTATGGGGFGGTGFGGGGVGGG